MHKSLALAAAVVGFLALSGINGCGSNPVNPGPNPACASAANALGSVNQGLGIATTAWSIGKAFISNGTIVLAITTALDSAQSFISTAQGHIAAGDCDIKSYIDSAAQAIETALADIAAGRASAHPSLAASPESDPLSMMLQAGHDKAEEAKKAITP